MLQKLETRKGLKFLKEEVSLNILYINYLEKLSSDKDSGVYKETQMKLKKKYNK